MNLAWSTKQREVKKGYEFVYKYPQKAKSYLNKRITLAQEEISVN